MMTAITEQLWTFLGPQAVIIGVILAAWSQVEWNKGEVSDVTMTTTKEAQATMILPMRWMLVFTNAFMASLWWIGVCLAKWYQHWTDYNATQGPHLLFMRRARVCKPPD